MFDLIQLFLESSDVLLIILGYARDRVFAGNYPMVFVDGTAVDAVDT